jgi:hypothetical protein
MSRIAILVLIASFLLAPVIESGTSSSVPVFRPSEAPTTGAVPTS